MKIKPSLPLWSANQVRFSIRILLILVCWPLMTLDFSAVPHLKDVGYLYDHHFHLLNVISVFVHSTILSTELYQQLTLGLIALLSVAAIVSPRRWLIFVTAVPVFLIELVYFRYRLQLYDIDFPLAVLILITLLPVNWKTSVLVKGSEKSFASTCVGFAMLTYVCTTYFLAGISKLDISIFWWRQVDLGALSAVMKMWHGAEFNGGVLGWTVPQSSNLFNVLPALDHLSSLMTMLIELSYPMVLIFSGVTIIMPLIMSMIHTVIFLGSGISFHALAISALAIALPTYFNKKKETNFKLNWLQLGVAFLIGVVPAAVPAILNNHIHPFSNHRQFGWKYAGVRTPPGPTFSPGVLLQSGAAVPMPLEYGGFLGFRHFSTIQEALTSIPSLQASDVNVKLQILCKSLRPFESNFSRVGLLSYPAHLASSPTNLGMIKQEDLVIIKKTITWQGNDFNILIEPIKSNGHFFKICELSKSDFEELAVLLK
ncbi:MAG: hypothetical protein ACXVAX_03300 [Pseudobdellovibrio sp.]